MAFDQSHLHAQLEPLKTNQFQSKTQKNGLVKPTDAVRNLVVILGDQLDLQSPVLQGFDPKQDLVWMAEVTEESTVVWSHKARTTYFLSAMRHFCGELQSRGWRVLYRDLNAPDNQGSLTEELRSALEVVRPKHTLLVQPGEWRLLNSLKSVLQSSRGTFAILPDTHFICSHQEFQKHQSERKQLRMEFFYREMRRKTGTLMEGESPIGGAWNFDAENRESFGKHGPTSVPDPIRFKPDSITQEVIKAVEKHFPNHPGNLEAFDWPVTREEALLALKDFIEKRLPQFGRYQDAMWSFDLGGELMARPYLFHSRLSAALNLKLLNPLEVIAAAEKAYHQNKAPLESVEGFIRQILGWREYVRAIYWSFMPDYIERNSLEAKEPLPAFYWTGNTSYRCLQETLKQTLDLGFAHHIQRLMVTGLFSLLLGVDPKRIHEWYLAIYVDAIEWVELPNTLGMSQYADGGIMASKPYIASGKYIQRMSNYCTGCPCNPAESTGPKACPFTTLYWDFLFRHEGLLRKNQRMSMQMKNADRIEPALKKRIQAEATSLRAQLRRPTENA